MPQIHELDFTGSLANSNRIFYVSSDGNDLSAQFTLGVFEV